MNPSRVLLAVNGIDGSGKSFMAKRLAAAMIGDDVPTIAISVDDFRRPISWTAEGRSETDIYYDDYFDLAELDRCLTAFLAGAASYEIQIFDSQAHRIVGTRELDFRDRRLAIVEGIFALRVAAIAARAGIVYLKTGFSEARHRITTRDTARGRTPEDVNHRIDVRYFPGQRRYIADHNPEKRAHILIDNEDVRAPRLLRYDADPIRALSGAEVEAVLNSVFAGLPDRAPAP